MGYVGRIANGVVHFGGQVLEQPATWYFPKGGTFEVSGTPSYAELAASLNEPVHLCNGDLYLGGSMPAACGGRCVVGGVPTGTVGASVWGDGSSVSYAAAPSRGLSSALAMVGLVALASFLGISSEVSTQTRAGSGKIHVVYGAVIKDVALVLGAQVLWGEAITQMPHPSVSAVVSGSVYHAVHFVAAAVASTVVAGAFNKGRLFVLAGAGEVSLDQALLGRAGFEVVCLLSIALVGPIMPAQSFAAVTQLATAIGIVAIVSRDVAACHLRDPSFGTKVAADLLLLSSAASATLLAVPFCVDTPAVPVGLELVVAGSIIFQVGAAAAIFAHRSWGPDHRVDEASLRHA
jgi:hypothetical protein